MYTRRCSHAALKNLQKFLKIPTEIFLVRSSRLPVFYKVGAIKNFAKFTGKQLYFLLKSIEIKIRQHKCFLINFAKLLETSFLHYASGRLLLHGGVCL